VIFSRKSAAIWPFASSIKIAARGVQELAMASEHPFLHRATHRSPSERGLLATRYCSLDLGAQLVLLTLTAQHGFPVRAGA
jgi:hypothetical protein